MRLISENEVLSSTENTIRNSNQNPAKKQVRQFRGLDLPLSESSKAFTQIQSIPDTDTVIFSTGRQNLQFASLGHEQGQIVSDTAFIEFLLFFYGNLDTQLTIADTPGTITFGKTIQDQSVFDTVLSITSPVSDVSP